MRATIAIGSNSTRMLAAEKKGGRLENLLRGREETRLFLGMDERGNIRPQRIQSTAQAVKKLYDEAVSAGAKDVAIFATSAMRDAANGQDLADAILKDCGVHVRIISGEEEARLAFAAAAGEGKSAVMDIGGGSTEFTVGEMGRISWAGSAQMGASRLMKACPVFSLRDAKRSVELARRVIAPLADKVRAFGAETLTGLGGSCTTSAAMLLGREAHGEEIEGYPVSIDDVRRFLELLSPMTIQERKQVPGLPASRAEHMPNGLCILLACMEESGFDRLTVSIRTNLDGYLLSLPDEI